MLGMLQGGLSRSRRATTATAPTRLGARSTTSRYPISATAVQAGPVLPDDSRPLRLADVQVLTMKMLEILRTSDRQ